MRATDAEYKLTRTTVIPNIEKGTKAGALIPFHCICDAGLVL